MTGWVHHLIKRYFDKYCIINIELSFYFRLPLISPPIISRPINMQPKVFNLVHRENSLEGNSIRYSWKIRSELGGRSLSFSCEFFSYHSFCYLNDYRGCGPTHTILIVFGYNITLFVSESEFSYYI